MISVIEALPATKRPGGAWHPTRKSPCAVVFQCSSCSEYLPITSFYVLNRRKSGARTDILNQQRGSSCKKCNILKYTRLDQRRKMLYAARHHAKEKGVQCSLSIEDIVIPSHCPVLGLELKAKVGHGRPNCRDLASSPSIDRVVGALGYIPGNVNVISTRANHLKSNGTLEEFQAIFRYMQECEAHSWPEPKITAESNDLEVRKHLFYSARKRSRTRNLEFSLTTEDIKIPECCPVLGVPLRSQWYTGCKTYRGFQHSPSVDRIDNSMGYTSENIRIISARANHLKSDAALWEIRAICDYIASTQPNDTNGGVGV